MKTATLLAMLLLLMCSCTNVFTSLYGIKNPREQVKEDILKKGGKYHVDKEVSFVLHDAYLRKEYEALPKESCVSGPIYDLLQPLQVRIFDKAGQLIGFQSNCHCGGFPNLAWDRLGLFDTLPPREISNTWARVDTSFTFNEDYRNSFLPINAPVPDVDEFADVDYKIIVFWSIFMGRQSKRLIKKVQGYVDDYPDLKINVIYVNTDNLFFNR